jgi:hypothetical protein
MQVATEDDILVEEVVLGLLLADPGGVAGVEEDQAEQEEDGGQDQLTQPAAL